MPTSPATPEAIAHAIALVSRRSSPTARATSAAALAALDERDPTDVIYIGDGIPTWGEQRAEALGALADKVGAPIEAALIGKGATTDAVVGAVGPHRRSRDDRAEPARRAAVRARRDAGRRAAPDRRAARSRPSGAIVFPHAAATVFAGDELSAVMKTPVDQPLPAVGPADRQARRQAVRAGRSRSPPRSRPSASPSAGRASSSRRWRRATPTRTTIVALSTDDRA